jgi:hypothetical protein
MKYKITMIVISFLLFGLGDLHAQESTPTSGGEATGTGGTLSYTVGQVIYTKNTGTNGSLTQGVQQPYEISTTAGIKETTINLELSVYPNPTTDYLTLKVEDYTELNYQLCDLQGKVIQNKKVSSTSMSINIEHLPKAIYFLNVTKSNQTIKTFKIIKN